MRNRVATRTPVRTTVRSRPVRSYAPLYPPRMATSFVAVTDPEYVSLFHSDGPSPTDANPEMWARALASAILDAVEGRRDLRSLDRWLTRELFHQLSKSCGVPQGAGSKLRRAKPHSTRIWCTSRDVAEVAVTVWDQDRLRAVAMRMVRKRQGWIVSRVEYG